MTDLRATATVDKRQRLHPLSPILRSLKTIGVIIAAISWQGFDQFGVYTVLIGIAVAAFAGLVWSWIAWHFMGYTIIGTELHISDGVISRRHRTIPLQRLQSVEVVQPFVGRILGLAELRCEVVGAAKAEAPLAYLALPQAQALRKRLLALASGGDTEISEDSAHDTSDSHSREEKPATLVSVPVKRLIQSQLLTVNVFFIPFATAATIAMFWWQPDLSLIGIGGLIAATAGVLLAPIRKAMVDYDFTLGYSANRFRIRKGLTERTTQTLPLNRITAVTLRWPLLWRKPRWVSSTVAHAGQTGQSSAQSSGGTLLPVATHDEADRVLALAFDSVTASTVVSPVPRRARWLAPFGWRYLGAELASTVFVTRYGRVTRTMVVVPYERIQSVRVVQGRLQRVLNVATVHVDIAGGAGLARAEHRDAEDALHMAQMLRDNAREAAAAPERRAQLVDLAELDRPDGSHREHDEDRCQTERGDEQRDDAGGRYS